MTWSDKIIILYYKFLLQKYQEKLNSQKKIVKKNFVFNIEKYCINFYSNASRILYDCYSF